MGYGDAQGSTANAAPITASFITLSADGKLTAERVLTAGSGVAVTDGGAGTTVTLSLTALTGNWDAGSFQIRAETFQSDVATGTAPFTVASTTAVTNLNADTVDGLEGSAFVQVDGSIPLTANWDVGAFTITGTQFISDIAIGTAPLVVTSTTVCANLNADTVDGLEGSAFVQVDGSIPLTANWDVGAFTITGTQFISDIAGGTAPFVATSTTVCTNLNADLLDGSEGAAYALLAGGTTFTGALTCQIDQDAETTINCYNNTGGAAALASVQVQSNSCTGRLIAVDDGYTTANGITADYVVLSADSTAAGLTLLTGGNAPVTCVVNTAEAWRTLATGEFIVGATSLSGTEQTLVQNNQNTSTYTVVKNTTSNTLAKVQVWMEASAAAGGMHCTSAGYTPTVGQDADQVILSAASTASGGLNLLAQGNIPVVIKTGATPSKRLEIDGTGQTAFFGGTPAGQVAVVAALTDNSGGSANDTIAAITNAANAGSADVGPTADAIADLAAKVNALLSFAKAHNLMASS